MLTGIACFHNTSEVYIKITSQFTTQQYPTQAGFVLLSAAGGITISQQFHFYIMCFPPSEKSLSIFLGSDLFYILKPTMYFPGCHHLQAQGQIWVASTMFSFKSLLVDVKLVLVSR